MKVIDFPENNEITHYEKLLVVATMIWEAAHIGGKLPKNIEELMPQKLYSEYLTLLEYPDLRRDRDWMNYFDSLLIDSVIATFKDMEKRLSNNEGGNHEH